MHVSFVARTFVFDTLKGVKVADLAEAKKALCICVSLFAPWRTRKKKIWKRREAATAAARYTCQRITYTALNPCPSLSLSFSFYVWKLSLFCAVFIVAAECRRKNIFSRKLARSPFRTSAFSSLPSRESGSEKKNEERKKRSRRFSIHAPRSVEANFSRV